MHYYFRDTLPMEFIGDLYDIMRDRDNDMLTPERLIDDIVDLLRRYIAAHSESPKEKSDETKG